MMYCEFGSFNEHTKRSETERGSDFESQMTEVGKRLRSENRWELLPQKTYTYEVNIFKKRNSCRFIRYKIRSNSSFSTAAKIESKNTLIP